MANARTTSPKPAPPRLSLAEVMVELEAAGSAQTRKTYLRHGATEPLFGVSFATLKALLKRIRVDHELAVGLWDTGNHDARNLAVKVADPARLSPEDLDRWARGAAGRICGNYVALLALDGPHAHTQVATWLASTHPRERESGWNLVGQLALRDTTLGDERFVGWLEAIEATIHGVPDSERYTMNGALIAIGCRNPELRALALAAAGRIGVVLVDHGDTACETPDAASAITKAWAYTTSKGIASPAAAERGREPLRLRC